MNEHIDYQFRVTYLVLNPEGEQVWASNYKQRAESEAAVRNRTRPGHTVEEKQPEQPKEAS